MRYRVVIPKNVQKDYLKLDRQTKVRVCNTLLVLSDNPYVGKKLKGEYKDQYSVRIWPYRIIYEIYQKEKTVNIIRIGHRQAVYK